MDASPASVRKLQRKEKKDKEKAIVSTIRILMLVPRRQTFVFHLACSDPESQHFYTWLNDEHNNSDFLVQEGLLAPSDDLPDRPLVSFHESDGQEKATCNQANMIMAFLAARKLCNDNMKPLLRFTYIDNFVACLSNKMELCASISKHFDLIVLCPASDIRKAGIEGNARVEELHRFCAHELLQAQVFTYPPLSFAFFFEDKYNRDKVFQDLKLPFVYSNVTDSPAQSAQNAIEALMAKYPDNGHVAHIHECGIVAKTTNNHCALGVYFFQQTRGTWEVTSHNEHPFVAAGTRMRFEPLVSEAKNMESRIFATLVAGDRVSIHYKVQTSLGPEGTTTIERPAVSLGETSSEAAERKIVKDACHLFCAHFPHWKKAAMHLTLRFDIFHCSDKLYLNEVDVVPLAYLLLDDYFGTKSYLIKVSDEMETYIRKKWGSWPA